MALRHPSHKVGPTPSQERRTLSNLFSRSVHDQIAARIEDLRPDSPRQWGRMTPHQALCHLNDSFKAIFGDRPLDDIPLTLKRRVQRFVAFTLPVAWPKGVPTSPEVDAEKGGTPPDDFERDRAELIALVHRFADTDGRGIPPHYVWGAMSRGEWGRYGYRHLDHHLRQFGA